MEEFSTRGKHITADLWGVDPEVLNDSIGLIFTATKAVHRSGATLLKIQSKKFEPQGVTILLLLSESHLSMHTYPEKGFIAIDIYTCGEHVDPMKSIEYLIDVLSPAFSKLNIIERGIEPDGRERCQYS